MWFFRILSRCHGARSAMVRSLLSIRSSGRVSAAPGVAVGILPCGQSVRRRRLAPSLHRRFASSLDGGRSAASVVFRLVLSSGQSSSAAPVVLWPQLAQPLVSFTV